ncbi:MAG TPA: D-alanyl-D-alanine carboxypeptidase/D-alanyl-D-alanine-endopeptidase, partial [Pontimonas sp.]|nr:D-alanyl-D-alanine carboxypeptidase/D-alanyl-D-alanine-endopeptidase [Pontimonas sp.]
RGMDTLLAPASVQKVLTGVAALNTLGPDTTFQTVTLSTEDPEVLVVKAGGDLTLSATPEGAESVYIGAAKLADLAEQTIAVLEASLPEDERVTIRELVVDASLWDPEDNWREAWASSARTNGFISRITPLQIDGDRVNPSAVMAQRSGDPMGRAASAFVTALRQAGNSARFVSVSFEPIPEGATPVASVSSRPVSDLVNYMVKESDNTLAEMLGRHISLAQGLDGSGDSVGEGLMTSLASLGIAHEGVVIDDASGLSGANRLTPDFVASVLSEVVRSEGDIGLLAGALPIAGVDGSLDNRFTGDNAVAQGRVFAKTGSIQGTRSLAGWVRAEDDSALVFAFFATGEVSDDARTALETVVTGVFSCGANLADF